MGEGRTDDAIAIFAVNVAEFPDSWNAYDSLAEAYETSGDRERALMFYEKSLSLNPTSPTGLAAVARLDGEAGTDSARRD
jgi:tetratricopeptide (TPR) repeat protein